MTSTAPARGRHADQRRRQREDHDTFRPERLSPEEDAESWAGCKVAAEPQTTDPSRVPTSRAEAGWGTLPSPAGMEQARRSGLARA
jgi:hypothetical protein